MWLRMHFLWVKLRSDQLFLLSYDAGHPILAHRSTVAHSYTNERRFLAHNGAHTRVCTPCHSYQSFCGIGRSFARELDCVRSPHKKPAELFVRRRVLVRVSTMPCTCQTSPQLRPYPQRHIVHPIRPHKRHPRLPLVGRGSRLASNTFRTSRPLPALSPTRMLTRPLADPRRADVLRTWPQIDHHVQISVRHFMLQNTMFIAWVGTAAFAFSRLVRVPAALIDAKSTTLSRAFL
jgi:hypothetical protein